MLKYFVHILCLSFLLYEAFGQIQNRPEWTGMGNYYNALYPPYQQAVHQYNPYPLYTQYYQHYIPYAYASNQPQFTQYDQQFSADPSIGQSLLNLKTEQDKNTIQAQGTIKNLGAQNQIVETEIIDVDPQYFRYLYPIPTTVPQTTYSKKYTAKKVPYVVKVESQQFNNTNIPQVYKKHDVQHKTFTYRKTFVLNPGQNEDSVINLNFVNGVPVTSESPENSKEETTRPEIVESITNVEPTTESPTTTTENENPKRKAGRRFIDVPEACPENTIYTEGRCWKRFSLTITESESSENDATTE